MKRSAFTCALVPFVVYLVGGGCTSSPSPYDEVEQWLCFEDASSCRCYGVDEGTPVSDPRRAVVSCRAELPCCFVNENSDGSFDCRCVELPATPGEGAAGAGGEAGGAAGSPGVSDELACHAEAIDHGSTEVVPRCPPVTLDNASVCALAFESCDPAYLAERGLIACCNGLGCKPDARGQPICQP